MLNIKLSEYGLENTLEEISECLESAIKSNSKKRKNEIIHKALGVIDTLYYVIDVTEVDVDTKCEEVKNEEDY